MSGSTISGTAPRRWPKAAGASSKEISQQLGHSRQSFTDTTYVTVFPDVAKAAAEAAAAIVPRKSLAQDS
jgi:integrase